MFKVRSKLLVPNPAGLLHRPRVCTGLERGLECKLTLVCAPAGYGKTSALVDFARHSPLPVCWYTGDEHDRDLVTFVEYLVGAIGERFPGFGARTRAASGSLLGDAEHTTHFFHDPSDVIGEFVNEIVEIDAPFVVVVDNYDALDGAFGIRTFVSRLLQVMPFNCHLMLGSRVLASVPITHLVAKRQLAGLTDGDLRFSPQEIQALLHLSHVPVTESQAEALAANAEGWITGVLLLADLLHEGARAILLDAERVITEAHESAYEYLAKEVLSLQPPDVQDFLRTSAVLEEMSLPLCREVLQIEQPQALLAEVRRRSLFVTEFGSGAAATYRYHNLFRDFLHQQLRQHDPARYTELHRRAAHLFERESDARNVLIPPIRDVEGAVYHYLAAEAYPEATTLMERVAMEWFTRGRVETLLGWAEALPEEARAQAPRLSLYQSRALTDRYDYEEARQALAYAEAGFAAQKDQSDLRDARDVLIPLIPPMRAHMARVHNQRARLSFLAGRYEDAIAQAQQALEGLAPDETLERAQAQRHVGRAYVGMGRLAEGVVELGAALALFRQVGSLYDVANLLQDLTVALTAQGRFDEAAACVNEALTIGRRLGAPALLAGVLNDAGCLYYARGEYREALDLYEEGLAAAQRGNARRLQAYILVGMADLYRDVGAYERAAPLYDAGWHMVHESEPGLAVYVLAAQASMARWQGDHAGALALLAQARQLARDKGLDFEEHGLLPMDEGMVLVESVTFPKEPDLAGRSVLLHPGGEIAAGLRLLEDAAHFLEQRQAKRELARARFLLAKAHLQMGDQGRALEELHRAMGLAAEIGTRQFAVVEGQHAEPLLRLGVAASIPGCREVAEGVQQLRTFREEQRPAGIQEGAEETSGRIEIYAFGEGRVVRDGHPVSPAEWHTAQARELFFYILLHGPLERDAIGLEFWPDASSKKMVDSFHTALYRIRRAAGANVIVTEGGQYRLGEVDYWFDVREFEALVERARLLPPHDVQAENLWQRAVALYRGDLLPEVERVWCVPKRETLRDMVIEALSGIGQHHAARRDFEQAAGWYRHALQLDELREDLHRHVMHCYAEAGRRAEALAQYRRCQEILERELSIEPSPETQALYAHIAGKKPG